ncbi:hypothetical protein [Terricaulis sp.]|uniref:hypothetical protein n=1 Tax=Terricaulis sp. TaxID=2768686 RepID=UPI003783D4D7
MRAISAGVLALGILAATPAGAMQQSPEYVPTTDSEDIVVTAEREVLRSFVAELSQPNPHEDQIARWDSRVCLRVAGLDQRHGQYLVDRIAARAHELGLRPAAPGCRANVVIFVTRDADMIASAIADDHDLVAYYNNAEFGNALGRAELQQFASTDAPVRWWFVSHTADRSGRPIPTGGMVGSPGSRLQSAVRQDFNRVLIVVDAQQAQGVRFDALADYLSMVSLAQLDPAADTSGFPTILNLFSDRASGQAGPASMTEWDTAYLEGLYRAPRNASSARQQRWSITNRMQRELTPPEDGQSR